MDIGLENLTNESDIKQEDRRKSIKNVFKGISSFVLENKKITGMICATPFLFLIGGYMTLNPSGYHLTESFDNLKDIYYGEISSEMIEFAFGGLVTTFAYGIIGARIFKK